MGVRRMEFRDAAEVTGATTAAGTAMWLIFRFLVGAAVADAVKDISNLKTEVTGLKHSLYSCETKVDQLLVALASNK